MIYDINMWFNFITVNSNYMHIEICINIKNEINCKSAYENIAKKFNTDRRQLNYYTFI